MVRGNLLEVAFKTVNLLVAPLFGLFFMALFVQRATARSAMIGAAVGVVTVVLITYWEPITGRPGISFLWAAPAALVLQIVAGVIATWLERRTETEDRA